MREMRIEEDLNTLTQLEEVLTYIHTVCCNIYSINLLKPPLTKWYCTKTASDDTAI